MTTSEVIKALYTKDYSQKYPNLFIVSCDGKEKLVCRDSLIFGEVTDEETAKWTLVKYHADEADIERLK